MKRSDEEFPMSASALSEMPRRRAAERSASGALFFWLSTPNPFSEFVGHGAMLLAMGRAARQASIAAGGDAGAREGRSSSHATSARE